jgi:wyosine [tRNA(Phe)-imidazoG37] synthetase (radical SAM superfamily)
MEGMTTIYDDERMRLYPERVLALREGRTPAPVQVLISPCDTCNHRCGFCTYRDPASPVSELFLTERGSPPVRQMADDVLMDLPGQLASMGVRAVQVTGGGEPMLHPRFGDFCQALVDHGLAFAVVTNGTRCKPDGGHVLGYATWIRVSINAGTEEAYREAHRCGRGEWQKAWGFVAGMKPCDTTIGVSMVATDRTAWTATKLASTARTMGADYVRITADYRNDDGAWSVIEAQADALADLCRPYFRVILKPPVSMTRPTQKACYYQAVAPYIGADAKLYRCCNTAYTEAGTLGDLNTEWFASAWQRLNISSFDATGCPECAFQGRNAAIGRLVAGPGGHELVP